MEGGRELGFRTRSIHSGYEAKEFHGALNVPLFMTSTFEFDNVEQGGKAFLGQDPHPIYSRLGNPTNAVLEKRIADLEGAEAGACFASGMGAICSVMWTFLHDGSHVIVSDVIYGCTWSMFNHAKDFGINVDPVCFKSLEDVFKKVRPDTQMVYFESPCNPDNTVIDIKAVAEGVKKIAPNCLVVVDNTYPSPAISQPIKLGADIVVHSATKYISGHGDVVAGIVVGKAEHINAIKMVGLKDMTGAVMSTMSVHLLLRGLKTLKLRMEQHGSSALKIAEYLEANKHVKYVNFPFLKSSPYYEIAKKQMAMPNGMISFELNGTFDDMKAFMNALKICKIAVSLGDCETLIENPATMTHAALSAEELKACGITQNLLRLSVGLENTEDLIADIDQAIKNVFGEK